MNQRVAKAALALVLLAATCAGVAQTLQPAAAGAQAPPPVFATVGDTVITQDEYNAAFSAAARSKFYHGKSPEGGIALLQREVGDELVTRVLLLREAKRRGLLPDQEEMRKTLDGYEQRYSNSEQWKKDRSKALPALTGKLEQESLLKQLEQAVRASAVPDPEQIAAYYAAHPDKFTEPEQLHLQIILLKVDPSSPKASWDKAEQDAQDILKQLRGDADFAELARQRSGDNDSAQQGGDLGYRHSGMLPDEVQAVFKELKPGDLSSPVRLLQGFAVFRLSDRKAPKLMAFDASKERAQQLLQREQADLAWKALAVGLKQETPAQIDPSRYLPLSEPPTAQSPTR